jgi:alpha-methylacyl-CoA racemase
MGPLAGVKIVEFGAIGPGPFCAMLLSDMGAEVIRLDRLTPSGLGVPKETRFDTTRRGRRSLAVNLKSDSGREAVMRLLAQADGLIEGYRPGVMERLGFGPDACLAVNPRLVFGRMTGWGQDGPMAQAVGHDINYLALSGTLSMIGREGASPAIPLNLVADLGGGALYLALGMVAALYEAARSGQGQVVDAAIIDGVASLMTTYYGYLASGQWEKGLERNFIDGGAPWYNVYETRDGLFVSVGAVEAKFYHELVRGMGLDPASLPGQFDRARWPEARAIFADVFRGRTREEWEQAMVGLDACFAPVLDMEEAMAHPQFAGRRTYAPLEGVPHPQPAPRFSRTPSTIQGPPRDEGTDTEAVLADWGFSGDECRRLRASGAIL